MKRSFSIKERERQRTAKASWDVSELRKKARYILTLSSETEAVLQENTDYAANVFAVLAPSVIGGCHIDETLILEIGIGKGTPYHHTFRKNSRGEWLAADRRKVRDPTQPEQAVIWERFRETMIRLTQARRAIWKKREPYYRRLDDGKTLAINRGQHFLVSRHDRWIFEEILDLEWRNRWKRYLHEYATWIRFWLRKYRFTEYQNHQAKNLVGLRKTLELLSGIKFRHPYLAWRFIEAIGRKSSLIRNTLSVSKREWGERTYAIPHRSLPLLEYHIFIDRVSDAREVLVFECTPDAIELDAYAIERMREYRSAVEEDPDDIPFSDDELAAWRTSVNPPSIDPEAIPF